MLAQQFLDASSSIGIDFYYNPISKVGGGIAIFDYNNDGLEDIYLVGGRDQDGLFQNDGNGSYTNVSDNLGLSFTDTISTLGVVTGDIDNDGIREIFVATNSTETDNSINDGVFLPNILLKFNPSLGKYENIAHTAGLSETAWSIGGIFGDYNKDGFLDLFVVNYIDSIKFSSGDTINHRCARDFIYLNQGNGTFTEVSTLYGINSDGCSFAASFTDYDKDNDTDLFVVNDYGMWQQPNYLYQNDFPNNLFTDVSSTSNMDAAMHAMGIATGDYNEDGLLDYYVSNIGHNYLFTNNGDGTFTENGVQTGVDNTYADSAQSSNTAGWGTGFYDFDNDSYLDLFVSNGFVGVGSTLIDPNKLYRNNGNGTFTDISTSANVADKKVGRGAAFGDLDQDGDLDIIVQNLNFDNGFGAPKTLVHYNIITSSNNWVKITLEGTISNRDAYGALVTVYAGGRKFIQELQGGSSSFSQNSSVLHFGLGSITQIDSVVVNWPNGLQELFLNLSVKQQHHLIENTIINHTNTFINQDILTIYPNPTRGNINVSLQTDNPSDVIINIYSVTGQFLFSEQFKTQNTNLDLSFLESGIYHFEVISSNFKHHKKLIILH